MGRVRPLHRVTIGRSREVRGPDGLERGFVGIVITVLMAMGVWFGMQLVHITQTLDAITLASGPETNEVIYYAVHGRWPSPDNPYMIAGNDKGRYTNSLTLDEGGIITAKLALRPISLIGTTPSDTGAGTLHGSLSFRPELLGARDAPTISFLCGYAKPAASAAATIGVNRTTLDKQFLPPFCR